MGLEESKTSNFFAFLLATPEPQNYAILKQLRTENIPLVSGPLVLKNMNIFKTGLNNLWQ